MYKQGFLKIELATPKINVGDISNNEKQILEMISKSQAGIIVFPELSLTGYTASDLFFQEEFISRAKKSLESIVKNNQFQGLIVVGTPLEISGSLFNVAVAIHKNRVIGIVPKYYLPNHHEFYEKRWFQSGLHKKIDSVTIFGSKVPFGNVLFSARKQKITIGIEVCQDLWVPKSPSTEMALAGANVILNLSASTENMGKHILRRNAVLDHSRKLIAAYLYTTTGNFESSSESLFTNHKIAAIKGELIKESELFNREQNSLVVDVNIDSINYERRQDSGFKDQVLECENKFNLIDFEIEENKAYRFEEKPNKLPFLPKTDYLETIEIVKEIQINALANKVQSMPKTAQRIVLGVSGGLDSTLALLVSHQAMKRLGKSTKDIIGVTMPSVNTTEKSLLNALELMKKLEITNVQMSIDLTLKQHLDDINHQEKDVTYENSQARIRTLNLMSLANMHRGFVLGTGDLSEIALGWMTYNGDQMSMYAVNSGITKTWVRVLVDSYKNNYPELKELLESILKAPISPELLSSQNTEEIIGSYEVNDFILYHHIATGNTKETIYWLVESAFDYSKTAAKGAVDSFFKRFYDNQFKRATLPEGPKILSVSLSPRGEYRMPSDIKRK